MCEKLYETRQRLLCKTYICLWNYFSTSYAMHAAYLKFLPQTIITYWWLFTLCKKDLEGLLAIYTDRRLRKNQSESFGRSSFLLLNNLSFYDLCLVCIQFFKHTEAKIRIIYLTSQQFHISSSENEWLFAWFSQFLLLENEMHAGT